MTEVQFSGLKGGTIGLSSDILTALRPELRGSLCLSGEEGYDEARTIWNAMIDRRPGAVVRCGGASDVMRAVRLARDNGLLVAGRGGGAKNFRHTGFGGGAPFHPFPQRPRPLHPPKRTPPGET